MAGGSSPFCSPRSALPNGPRSAECATQVGVTRITEREMSKKSAHYGLRPYQLRRRSGLELEARKQYQKDQAEQQVKALVCENRKGRSSRSYDNCPCSEQQYHPTATRARTAIYLNPREGDAEQPNRKSTEQFDLNGSPAIAPPPRFSQAGERCWFDAAADPTEAARFPVAASQC